jgi:hypothetical protein
MRTKDLPSRRLGAAVNDAKQSPTIQADLGNGFAVSEKYRDGVGESLLECRVTVDIQRTVIEAERG